MSMLRKELIFGKVSLTHSDILRIENRFVRIFQKAIPDSGNQYKMDRREQRGLALIFNHQNFADKFDFVPRNGTMHDKIRLEELYGKVGFEVQSYDDLKFEEIEGIIDKVSVQDHAGSDCLLVTVLSYGTESSLFAFDKEYATQILWSSFTGDKCPSLAGKPKIFIIQVNGSDCQ